MFVLWLTAALAAPPAGVDETESQVWDDAADTILDGPSGCWEVVGDASWRWDFGKRFGYAKGDGVFIGRLEDGVWRDFVMRSTGEEQRQRRRPPTTVFPHDEVRFLPLVGEFKDNRVDEDGDGLGDNVLRAVLGRLGGDVGYAWAEWVEADKGIQLHRAIPFGDGSGAPEATLNVFFPEGGTTPTAATVDFPERFSVPGQRLVTVKNAVAKLRSRALGTRVFPEVETFSFEASVLGFNMSAAQTITYRTFRPCGGDTSSSAQAIGR